MDNKDKTIHYIIISVILSILIHIVILVIFENLRVSKDYILKKAGNKSQIVTFDDIKVVTLQSSKPKEFKTVTNQKDIPFKTLISKIKITPTISPLKNNRQLKSTSILPLTKKIHVIPAIKKISYPKTIQIDGDKISPQELKYNHLIIPKRHKNRHQFASNIYNKTKIKDDASVNSAPIVPPVFPIKLRISSPKVNMQNEPSLASEAKLITMNETISIDSFLNIQLVKFPVSSNSGYFKIAISTNSRTSEFQIFDRDIIFLIDFSGSIANMQLKEFIKGILSAIKLLGPNDRFEVVAFKDKTYPLFNKLTHPTKENIEKVSKFLSTLEHTGPTALYEAILPYIGKKYKEQGRPLLIFMASDGIVNSGDIASSRELINQISNLNQQQASIYTLTNSKNSNTFLLDLLSYRNRGDFINTKEISDSSKIFSKTINSTNEIILENLSYQISSSLASETFPKKLPNLYLNQPISLYGHYFKGINKISLRITGTDIEGVEHELIYSGSLDDALISNYDLPQNWAQQYIFNLYSKMTVNYDEKIKKQIYSLAKKFHIKNMYLSRNLVQ